LKSLPAGLASPKLREGAAGRLMKLIGVKMAIARLYQLYQRYHLINFRLLLLK
jgi:hypothetical protein